MKNKRTLSIFLVISMMFMLMPVTAFAETSGSVSVTLGADYAENGMSAWSGDGGSTTNVTYDGKSGWQTNPSMNQKYIYFNIDDSFIHGGTNQVNITIEYYDSSANGVHFGFSYDSTDTAWDYNVPKTELAGSGAWKTETYALNDAQFTNRENGADLRIETDAPVAFRSVAVEKAAEVSVPTAIHVNPADLTMKAGSVRTITSTIVDQNGYILNKLNVDWSSSDPAVAVVDSNGTITAVNKGTAIIHATHGSLTAQVIVTINEASVGPVSVIFGPSPVNNGIDTWTGDGSGVTVETYDGKTGWQTKPGYGTIYGNVSDNYIFDGKHKVTVTIEYYDAKVDGKQSFILSYDSVLYNWANGPTTTTYLTGTNTWKTVTYTLEDAKFAGRENNNADFRINTSAPICFSSITIEKIPIVTIEGSSMKTGNIFMENETPVMNLSFGNQFDTNKDLTVDYSVLDYSTSIVQNGQFNVNLNPNEPGLIKPLSFAALPKGTYTLFVNAANAEGSIRLNEHYHFSVVNDLSGKPVAPFLGMNSHYSVSWSNIDLGLPLIKLSGASNLRDGKPDVSDKASAYGIKMLTGVGLSGFSQSPAGTEQYYTDFSNYVKNYTASMKGKAEYMEVGNEYNSGGSAEQYFKFLKLAYAAVKSVDPDMKVVGGVAFQYDANWLKKLIDLGACDYEDAMSFHVYSNNNPENEGLVNNFQDLKNYIKSKGITKNIDLLLTETGYATQDPGWGGLPEITSAAYAAQLYVTTLANNDLIKKVYWYDFMNDGTDPTFYETNGGIVRADLTAKPSYVAFNAASDLLAGTNFVQSYNALDSNIRIYKFHRASDIKDILVLWANNNSQSINLNLGSNQLSVADLFGNIQNFDTINGSVTLTASAQPVYIEGNFTQDPLLGTTPTFTTDTSTVNAVPGDDVAIKIIRAAGAENLSGTYAVDLPVGWQLKSGGPFSAGQSTDTLTFTAPETINNKTGEIRIYPTSASGNLYGMLKIQTQMSDQSVVQMSPQVNEEGNGYDLTVSITNRSNKVSLGGGTVTVLLPENMAGSAAFDTIAPNSAAKVKFSAPSLNIYEPTSVKVRIDRNDGSSQVIERNITSLTAVKADRPIHIDGVINPDEWQNAMTFALDQASQVKMMTDWGGPEDLSAIAYTKWDANYLYLAASVTDNSHYNPYSSGISWQGDGIQFSIDPGRAQGPGTIKGSENSIALNSDTGAVMKTGGYGAGNLENSIIDINRDGSHTNYEMAIKWSDILPAGMTAASGTNIGFSFLVNDNDGSVRRGWMEYMSGIGLSKDPNLYGDLILTDFPSFPADSTAPVTSATVSPAQPDGLNGWYIHPVSVALSATDDISAVTSTDYSMDGGTTWEPYSSPLLINMDGQYDVSYRSSDGAGNVEAAKSLHINLDATAPVVSVSEPTEGSYPDSSDLNPRFAVSDTLSGVENQRTSAALDGQNVQQGTAIPLYTLPLGDHTFTVSSSDRAGNEQIVTVTFQTRADLDSLKALVTRFEGMNWIDNSGIVNSLEKKLDQGDLSEFMNEVGAQRGKHIASDAADYLLRDAQAISKGLKQMDGSL